FRILPPTAVASVRGSPIVSTPHFTPVAPRALCSSTAPIAGPYAGRVLEPCARRRSGVRLLAGRLVQPSEREDRADCPEEHRPVEDHGRRAKGADHPEEGEQDPDVP